MGIRLFAKEIITDVALIVLPLDILYLYFAGGWTEPNPVILYAELMILPLFTLFGIFRTIKFFKELY